MQAANLEIQTTNQLLAELIVEEIKLKADKTVSEADRDLKAVLFDIANVNQEHVWDTIDFYSRPEAIEAAEIEGLTIIEDGTLWIEYPDYDPEGHWEQDNSEVSLYEHELPTTGVIEDYYEKGTIWKIAN